MAAQACLLLQKQLKGKRGPEEDDLEKKPILKKHKEKETTDADILQQIKRKVDFFETEFVKGAVDGFDEPLYSVEEVAARKKTLLVENLSPQTKISHIIGFFRNVGEVVGVKLTVNRRMGDARLGVVEFASANEAKKALKKKNGECLCGHNIILRVADKRLYPPPRPKYYFDHKAVWYEDYLRRESLLIEENEGHDHEDTDSVSVRKKTVFVADLSPQSNIIAVCKFFRNVGQVVSVGLIANHEGKHVGCGFVEFVSANEAKKAMEEKNGKYLHDHKIFLDVPKIAPYNPRAKYNLAENPWYEDFLCQESLVSEEDETVERLDKDPDYVEEVAGRKKTLFIGNLSPQTEVLDICIEFHRVREVVHVRLNVDPKGEHDGYGFVEFASANEAKKALEEKNGVNVHDRKIILDVAKGAKYLPPKYCTDHKVWYKDYLRRESLLIEEVETVEGLVQEVVVRKKTLFVANLSPRTELSDVFNLFHNVGRVVSTRLIVNHKGKHVGCAFVEFASVNQAKKVLKKMKGRYLKGRKIFLDVAKIAPYPPRPKYNLVEKLWYEDYFERPQDDLMETKPPIVRFCGKKTTFVEEDETLEMESSYSLNI